MRVLLDCANGATHRVAPEIFRRMGAEVDAIAVEPDGRNINQEVGSTHIEALAQHMDGHDVAFAFDGDGDRVLAMDRNGTVVDGDELMALAALHLRGSGRLAGDGVAVTVMTNYGFHRAMADAGIEVATTDVGDRARARRAACAAAGRSAASSRATSSTRASCRPATARRPRCSRWRRSRAPTSPTATRWRSCPSGS